MKEGHRSAGLNRAVPIPVDGSTLSQMDLGDMVSVLWRGFAFLILAAVVGAGLGLTWALTQIPPSYRATAIVVLDKAQAQVVSFSDFVPSFGSDTNAVNTELEVLRSPSLIADLARSEDLIIDPEFNRYLRDQSLFWQQIARVKAILAPMGATAAGPSQATRDLNATIQGILEQVTVRNVPDSMVFEITFETGSPEKSARLANALAEIYLNRQLDAKFTATEAATNWLNSKVAVLELELAEAEAKTNRFTAEMELISPETLDILTTQLKDVRDTIAALDAAILRGNAPRNTTSRIGQLRGLEEELANKISRLSEDRVTLEQLQRESAASRQIYEYFLNRLKETTVQQGMQQADARLMSAALVPDLPSAPRPVLLGVLWSVIATFVCGAALVLAELRTATFRTAETLERATGLQVLGQIPKIPAARRSGVLDYVKSKPTSAAAEAIRNLRTSIVMSNPQSEPKVILCTSSLPSEGKTTQTLALAQIYGGLQRRVLVIEGDMRKRVFASYFGQPVTGGLQKVLSGKQTLGNAVWHHDGLNFDVLFSEDPRANAADIFSGAAFRRLIRQARTDYDVVLIDSPPVLLVPDARVIARLADAVLYTVRWDKTREKQVAAGLRAFASVGAPVTGLVLSQVNAKGMKRYGYGKDYGTYGTSGYYQN